jgi:hypothetical protein
VLTTQTTACTALAQLQLILHTASFYKQLAVLSGLFRNTAHPAVIFPLTLIPIIYLPLLMKAKSRKEATMATP